MRFGNRLARGVIANEKTPMKRLTMPALVLGSFLATVLVVWFGAGEVGHALASAGWGVLLVVIIRAIAVAAAAAGWFVLFPPAQRPRLSACLTVRFVREAANALLPTAQIGGDLIGARLLTFFRVDPALAGASVIVDVMMQAATQFTFALTGLAVLVALGGDPVIVRTVAIGLAIALPALGAFYLVQRRFGERLLGAVFARFGAPGRTALDGAGLVYERLHAFHAKPGRLAGSFLVHLAGWIVGVAEVWVALRMMGHPVTWGEALVVESLAQAVRGAAFAVPGAIGFQEGGLIALCALFGVPAGPALALSVLKRVPDLILGVPALLAWQAIEGRTFLGRRVRPSPEPDLRSPEHPAGPGGLRPRGLDWLLRRPAGAQAGAHPSPSGLLGG